MSFNLRTRLERVALTQPETERPRLLATLRVGAELALARIREIGGGYPSEKDITAVERELIHVQSEPEDAPSAAPAPLAEESTL